MVNSANSEKGKSPTLHCHLTKSILRGSMLRSFFCSWMVMSLAIALSFVTTAHASPPLADYDAQQPSVNYDEYPVVVPKRAAILLDRLMVALQKAAESDRNVRPIRPIRFTDGIGGGGGSGFDGSNSMMERRGTKVSGTWHQCYYNAVTCF